ncbi:transposase [Sulfurovum sp. bin170]|uniref:transposase n=1 Tax=Sulfurovum sp. bin170 TaxID=2695268 RepID=UPI0013DEF390|nr:transposase [Sulfurovum sp. bin170]NEW59721.1 transposase [Sulfurovum sp. bin170]
MPTEKFNKQYRVSSTRLQNWDYRWDGYYFITICPKDKEEYFGKIENGKMILSPLGVIADILWYEIKNHAKNIKLDVFVVMPNHIHGILILSGNETDEKNIGQKRFQNQGKNSISSIVGGYKSAVTKHAHRLNFEFGWQSRFYENIIRDEDRYMQIVDYVHQNPLKWENDKFFNIQTS